MGEQLDFWIARGWRNCANPECAKEWGPMPPSEFHISGDLCSVCYAEERAREAARLKQQEWDAERYTPTRRVALVQSTKARLLRMSDAERQEHRDRRRAYDRTRYLTRTA